MTATKLTSFTTTRFGTEVMSIVRVDTQWLKEFGVFYLIQMQKTKGRKVVPQPRLSRIFPYKYVTYKLKFFAVVI